VCEREKRGKVKTTFSGSVISRFPDICFFFGIVRLTPDKFLPRFFSLTKPWDGLRFALKKQDVKKRSEEWRLNRNKEEVGFFGGTKRLEEPARAANAKKVKKRCRECPCLAD